MPKSYEGRFSNIQVRGKNEYYPDGATILKADTEMDDLFVFFNNRGIVHVGQ